MEIAAYFDFALHLLQQKYSKQEAENFLYWIFEDTLLIKKAHIKLFSKELSGIELTQLNTILERLLAGEPIQYIYGYAYFLDLAIKVNPNVLIPRPETEELVMWAANTVSKESFPPRILDICTGSACIALSLKKQFPNIQVFALDISKEALEVAKLNASHLKLEIEFTQTNLLLSSGQEFLAKHQASLWICNPPYIKIAEKAAMDINVLDHEPHLALFVPDNDPLIFYRIVTNAFISNKTCKWLFFEISEFQEENLKAMLENLGLNFEFKKDLQSKTRMLRLSK